MIKTILIDDEEDSLTSLAFSIKNYCPTVEIIDTCSSPTNAINSINKYIPDLIFLDIEMPEINGFELLERVKELPLSVIFTTAFHKYAIQAIRYSALDFLVKPIDHNELILAIERYSAQKHKLNLDQFQFLLDRLAHKESTIKKLAIPNLDGFRLINTDDIIYCEADGNYTHIYLKGKQKLIATRVLGEIQNLLTDFGGFLRIHHSFLINYREVNQYIRGEGGHVIMSDGSEVAVSRNKKEILLQYIMNKH
jgi:two-component system LytT family response regulator